MPQTVPEELLQEANAANLLVNTVAEFAGPALATALVLGLGAGWAFAIDAATFLVSRVPAARAAARARRAPAAPASMLIELRDGWREFRVAHVGLGRSLICRSAADAVAFAPYSRSGRRVAEEVYGSTASSACSARRSGVGTIAGALIGLRWRPLQPLLAAMVLNLGGRSRR